MPRRVLGIARSPRIVRVGAAWHLGVLLLGDDAVLATGDIVRARQEAPRGFTAESQRQRAELAAAARRGGFAEGETVHIGWRMLDPDAVAGARHPARSHCATASRACAGAPRADTCRSPPTSTSASSCCVTRLPGRDGLRPGPKARANARSSRTGSVTDAASTRPAIVS